MAHPQSFDTAIGYNYSTIEEQDVGAGLHDMCGSRLTTRPMRRSARHHGTPRGEHAIAGPESGSYVSFEISDTGPAGTADYDRAMWESRMARENPNLLAAKTDRELDVSWHELIVPKKPQAVSLAGMTVFGTDGPTTTTRGMTTDFRGEAVDRYAVGPPPAGAALSGRMGNVRDLNDSYLPTPRSNHVRFAQPPTSRRSRSTNAHTHPHTHPHIMHPPQVAPFTTMSRVHAKAHTMASQMINGVTFLDNWAASH